MLRFQARDIKTLLSTCQPIANGQATRGQMDPPESSRKDLVPSGSAWWTIGESPCLFGLCNYFLAVIKEKKSSVRNVLYFKYF